MADNTPISDSQVQRMQKDDIGTRMGDRIGGLYYYYLEQGLLSGEESGKHSDNTKVLGTTDAICNVTYVPFLNLTNRDLVRVPFDTDRFGETNDPHNMLESEPFVYRIDGLAQVYKETELINKKVYNLPSKPSKGTTRNWKYETRLQDYPYRTLIFYSNVFNSYEVIPHLMDRSYLSKSGGYAKLYSCCPVSAQGNFYLNVQGYKDQSTGNNSILERSFINSSMDLPNTSSAYSTFMATQKARNSVNIENKLINAGLTPFRNMVNAGTMLGAGVGFMTGAVEGAINSAMTIRENLAMKQDLITTPNSLKSAGGDLIARLGVAKQTEVFAGEMTITDEYKEKLGTYFAMYGYKQNKLINLSKDFLRSRYYYNYIKTVGCNLKGAIPKAHINELKQIFDNGITLWHMDRDGVSYGDYSLENVEVN